MLFVFRVFAGGGDPFAPDEFAPIIGRPMTLSAPVSPGRRSVEAILVTATVGITGGTAELTFDVPDEAARFAPHRGLPPGSWPAAESEDLWRVGEWWGRLSDCYDDP